MHRRRFTEVQIDVSRRNGENPNTATISAVARKEAHCFRPKK